MIVVHRKYCKHCRKKFEDFKLSWEPGPDGSRICMRHCPSCGVEIEADFTDEAAATVCVSFAELYRANGAYPKNGGYIDSYGSDGEYHYDLRTSEPESANSILLACDGEEFRVIHEGNRNILLESCGGGSRLWLTKAEFAVAVFA